MNTREQAIIIYEDLNKRGAGLGNASISIIDKSLETIQNKSYMLSWFAVEESLPEIPEGDSSISVLTCWGPSNSNIATMFFSKDIVRNKEVRRFRWDGRPSPFKVKYWAYVKNPLI